MHERWDLFLIIWGLVFFLPKTSFDQEGRAFIFGIPQNTNPRVQQRRWLHSRWAFDSR